MYNVGRMSHDERAEACTAALIGVGALSALACFVVGCMLLENAQNHAMNEWGIYDYGPYMVYYPVFAPGVEEALIETAKWTGFVALGCFTGAAVIGCPD